ncbi:IS110 family transposase [Desulfurispora thermophila]|uniref:IS110 family transposase n=1 Tax=Desulfurispora thermophila TaxID=265470 RepID=UPI000381EE1B|nr:IS110 family transposase [Desulfurispora thermophila]
MNNTLSQKLAMVTPETLIVGVDVAKHTHYAQLINFRGEALQKPFPFQNTTSGIGNLVHQIKMNQLKHGLSCVLVAMEPTGHYWLPLACALLEQGIAVVMVNPHHVKKAKELDDNSPTKRDDKDAGVIARLTQLLKEIPHASYLLTIPGMSTVQVANIISEAGDLDNYSSARQLIKLAGLNLVENSSGSHKGPCI